MLIADVCRTGAGPLKNYGKTEKKTLIGERRNSNWRETNCRARKLEKTAEYLVFEID